jgi:Arm DNA-binding domain
MKKTAKGAQQVASIKGKIGLREIAAMPPGPFLMWDTELRGFNVRRQFSSAITYSVIYRAQDGRQHWLKIGRHGIWTPTLAREKAKSILLAVDMGQDPSAERHARRTGATVAELCDEYVADMESYKLNGKAASTKKSDRMRLSSPVGFSIETVLRDGSRTGNAQRRLKNLPVYGPWPRWAGLPKDHRPILRSHGREINLRTFAFSNPGQIETRFTSC